MYFHVVCISILPSNTLWGLWIQIFIAYKIIYYQGNESYYHEYKHFQEECYKFFLLLYIISIRGRIRALFIFQKWHTWKSTTERFLDLYKCQKSLSDGIKSNFIHIMISKNFSFSLLLIQSGFQAQSLIDYFLNFLLSINICLREHKNDLWNNLHVKI